MNILFQNKTKYSKSMYKYFSEFHVKKNSLKYFIFSIIILIFIVYYSVVLFKYNKYFVGLLSIIMAIVFILWRIYHPVYVTKKELRSDTIQKEKTFIFSFYKRYFTIYDLNDITKVYYFKLHKIFETSKFIYIYVDKSHAYILDKSCFVLGTSKDFSKFLKRKFWLRYKVEK